MKAKLVALAVISAFALSACGGGSDSSPKVNNKTNGGSAVSGDTGGGSTGGGSTGGGTTGGGTTGGGSTGGGSTGGGSTGGGTTGGGTTTPDTPFTMEQQKATYSYTMDSAGEPTSIATTPKYAKGNDGANFNKIQINGKTFTLPENSGRSGSSFAGDRRYEQADEIAGWEYSIAPTQGTSGAAYARYGWYRGENPAEIGFFYQGNPTAVSDMPTTGTNVTYKGYAMAVDINQQAQAIKNKKEPNAFYYGQSTFNVDFANKKMTGTLNDWQVKSGFTAKKEVKIVVDKGNIKGNTFKGTANGTGTAEGKFYGPKAQNLAGAFNDKTQNLQGVFGANKQ